jgi:hypothetical protein
VISDETGTGALVFANSPSLVTPALGTPSSVNLANGTGLPLATGTTGILPVASGGTGTATPGLVAGANITITGTWPIQTISSSGGGGGGGPGTVTSVGLVAPTGFSVTGSPVTTSGNITLSFAAGYSLPLDTSQANWNTAFAERLRWDGGSTGLDASAGRASLGLGSLATQSGTFSGTSSGTNTGDNAINSLYSGLVSNANHTGDASGSTVLTLATVNANVGTFGSATAAGVVTVNAKGLVTGASSATITPSVGSITGLGTGIATALAINVGSAGAPVLSGGIGGTPSSINLANGTGLPAAAIGDSTTIGRAVVTAADAAAARTAIGAGTSSLVVSSTAPAALGATAATGTSLDAARIDHVHQRDTDVIVIPVGDESTALTTGANKVRFRMPFAATLLAIRGCVNTAPTGSTLIVDVNEAGTSVLSTKLSIDASETSSTTAASAAAITDSNLADDAEISIDIDQIGSTVAGAGLKVYLFVRRA